MIKKKTKDNAFLLTSISGKRGKQIVQTVRKERRPTLQKLKIEKIQIFFNMVGKKKKLSINLF